MNHHKKQCAIKYHSKGGLDRFCNSHDLTKTSEDACYISRRDYDSRKPFKYTTYNYHPYGCQVQATCYPGFMYDDGHVSGCTVDDDSDLKLGWGNKLTNINTHQELPALPIIPPRMKGCFHVDVNSDLRFQHTSNWKPCTQLSEIGFNPYRFQFLSHLCDDYQNTEFIIPEDSFKKAFNDPRYHRAGADTRHDRLEKYRVGGGCGGTIFNRVMQNTNYIPFQATT